MAFNTVHPSLIGDFTGTPLEANPAGGLKMLVWNPQTGTTEHVDWAQLPMLTQPNFGTGAITGTLEVLGDGVKTTWTLPVAAVSKNNIEVVIDGVEDRSFTYDIAGPSISFTNPLPVGMPLFVRIFGGQTSAIGVNSVAGRTGDVVLAITDIASGVTTNRLLGNTSGNGKAEAISVGQGLTLVGGELITQLNADQIADGSAKVMMTVAERNAIAGIGSTNVWQDPVIDRISTPPGSPSTGNRYIVLPTGTGAWAGHNNDIAEWNGSSWAFATPSSGWVAVVTATATPYVFGQTGWSAMGGPVQSVYGRVGNVVAVSGDYTAAQITETASAKIMTDAERTKLATVSTNANAAGATGDAFAASHDGATGAAHGVATSSVAGFMPSTDKAKLDAATSSATASTLAMRDANGRLAVATPSAAGDATTKGYVDGLAFAGGVPKLDDCLAPDDNTDLNASTTAHGLMPKRDGDATHFYCSDGTQKVPPGTGGGGGGTTLEVYTDDPTFGASDDVAEVYLGKRVTLPAYNAGKQNRIRVINAGTTAVPVRATAAAGVVNGFRLANISGTSETRFVSSVNAPSIGSKLTISFWMNENSHTNNRGILHFSNGVEDSTTSYFRLTSTYASAAFLQLESRHNNTLTLLRRYATTQSVPHHVLVSLDLSLPSLVVVVDGVVLAHDPSLAGTTITAAQPIGGSSQPFRLCSKITGTCEEFTGALGQFTVWLNTWPSITEQYIRKFYNDGPVAISSATQVNGTTPTIHLNTAPPGAPAVLTNTGSLGGTLTDAYGSGVAALDVDNADSAMLEQIDGYPAGYTMPVNQTAQFIRRATNGVWNIVY